MSQSSFSRRAWSAIAATHSVSASPTRDKESDSMASSAASATPDAVRDGRDAVEIGVE